MKLENYVTRKFQVMNKIFINRLGIEMHREKDEEKKIFHNMRERKKHSDFQQESKDDTPILEYLLN
jgi:hypothetical protein